MKPFLLFACSILVGNFLYAQTLLYDQTNNLGTGGTLCRENVPSTTFDTEGADDFTVPTGEVWKIDSIIAQGFYNATAPSATPTVVTIYEDNGGVPGSTVVATRNVSDGDNNGDGTLEPYFPSPILLPAGTYWLSIKIKTSAVPWYWQRINAQVTANSHHWYNPGGGYAVCTTWQPVYQCLSSAGIVDSSANFQIYGCVNPPTINDLGADTSFCEGGSVTLSINSSSTDVSYTWNTGDQQSSITVDSSGHYVITVTDTIFGCSVYDDIDVTVHTVPISEIEDDTICEGDYKQFSGFNGCGTCYYIWNNTDTGFFFTTYDQGWTSLKVLDPATGCFATDSAWVEVQSTDPPQMLPGNEVDLCEGDTAHLSTFSTYVSYAWSTSENTPAIDVTEGGIYSVTVETSAGCETTDSVVVTDRPAPEPDFTIEMTNDWKIRLTATSGYQTYEWSNGKTEAVIIAGSTGNYTVTVTDEFGCEGEVTKFVLVTGIQDVIAQKMTFSPNPAHGYVNVTWPAAWVGNASLDIMDISGRKMKQNIRANEINQRIELAQFPSGYYLIEIHSPEGEGITRLVVE